MTYRHEGLSKPDTINAAIRLAHSFVDRNATIVAETVCISFEMHAEARRRLAELRHALKSAIEIIG